MAVLQSRLDQLEMARQAQMNAQHTQSLTDIGWGNQIRTYVLHVRSNELQFATYYIILHGVFLCSYISWTNCFFVLLLQPYRMVKDLRTNYEVSDPDSVLEGEIDGFILSFLSSSLDKEEALWKHGMISSPEEWRTLKNSEACLLILLFVLPVCFTNISF